MAEESWNSLARSSASGSLTRHQSTSQDWGLIWKLDWERICFQACVIVGRISVTQELLDWGPQFLAGYWPEAILISLLCEPFQHGKPNKRESGKKKEVSVLCNPITEVTSPHLCCILLVRSKSLGQPIFNKRWFHKGINTRRWDHWGAS